MSRSLMNHSTKPKKSRFPMSTFLRRASRAHTTATGGQGRVHGEEGYTLIELAIASAVMAEVMVIVLLLFDVNTRVSRVQIELADLQQSQRVAQNTMTRIVRMAGRGGLQRNAAIVVTDNVPTSTAIGGQDVIDETDILTVRGVFSTPIIQIDSSNPAAFTFGGSAGTLQVDSLSPGIFIAQPLDDLKDMLDRNLPIGMILVSAVNDLTYAVVEITGSSWSTPDINGDGTNDLRGVLNFSGVSGTGTHNASYLPLSSTGSIFPPNLTNVGFAGVIEEYRYYIRDDQTLTGGQSTKLSRAQFFPGTNAVFPVIPSNPATPINPADDSNGRVDIADNVLDLQIALAIDLNNDGDIDENPASLDIDEWMLNDENDNLANPGWVNRLFQARITTLVRTDRPDPGYMDEAIVGVENRDYSEPAAPTNTADQRDRAHRRRTLQSVADLRNIG